MDKVSEILSSKLNDAIVNYRQWGEMYYNVQNYGVLPGGVDVTTALQALVNKATIESRTAIFFPPGDYRVTSISNDSSVFYVGDNARFIGGYAKTINLIGSNPGPYLGPPAPHASTHVTGGTDVIPNAVAGGNSGLMSGTDKTRLYGIQAGAEVNQNAFSQINDIPATNKSDQLFLVGGLGITVSTNPTTKEVSITATGQAAPAAHASTHIPGGSDPIQTSTTARYGLTQLLTSTTSTSEALAATAKSVKDALDLAKTDATTKANAAETNAKTASLPKAGGSLVGNAEILTLVGTNHVFQTFYPKGSAGARYAYFGVSDGASDDFYLHYERTANLNIRSNGGLMLIGPGVSLSLTDLSVVLSVKTGNGSPEGVVTAPVGTLFLRKDGGASTTLYVKQSGTGNTGWVAK